SMGSEKAVREIMPFEVENVVPFPIEEMVVQGNIWKIEKESSQLITFSAHHFDVEKSAQPFLRSESNLKVIGTDPFTLSTIPKFYFGKGFEETYVGQLDIGGKVCIFNLIEKGALVHSRFFAGGGDVVTEGIMKLKNLGLEDAEELKHSIDFNIEEPEPELMERFQRKFSLNDLETEKILQMIRNSLKQIGGEVSKSLHTIHGSERPSSILISGGGSLFKGTERFLFELTGINFRRYDFLELPDERFANCLSIGYHYRLTKNERINFLTDEFSSRLNKNALKLSKFKPHIILTVLSLIILSTAFIAGIIIDMKKIEANELILKQKYKEGFGREAPEEGEVMTIANSEVSKEKKKSEIVRLFLSKESILDIIYNLTEHFPPKEGFDFMLDQFSFDGDRDTVYLEGKVNEITDLGTIQAALEKSTMVETTKIDSKRFTHGANKFKVTFKISIELVSKSEKKKKKKGK
ncbi:MAG: cell division FtsA domain-containing protein, partial [Leptospiraceae bacterium]|nr:cell division FtsA domain-containing protein [Leptospiraceae bacterium]